MKNKQKLLGLLFIVWCTAVSLWLYGDVLKLPFFFDDFVERPYVESLTLTQIWQTAGDLAYFRPLLLTIWKLITFLPGHPSPTLDHALNLLFFLADALLVGWLAAQLWTATTPGRHFDWLRAFLAATPFLFFPFSYQAVPWLGSLSHILSAFLILATIATYWQWRNNGRWQTKNGRLWAALSLFLALLTPFAHENGIIIPPLILALHLTHTTHHPPSPTHLSITNYKLPNYPITQLQITNYVLRFTHYVLRITHYALRPILPWLLPTLIWLPIWWAAPKAVTDTIQLQSAETLFQNTIYFLQGIAYPLTWLGGWLRETAALNDLLIAGTLSLIALFIAAVILKLGKADRRSLFPLLWIIIAALPSILLLRFDYIINGPRLLLLASVGAVWLWSDVIVTFLQNGRTAVQSIIRPARIRLALVSALLLVLLVQNGRFIKERMTVHQMLGSVYHEVVETATGVNERGQLAVFINLPSWITPGTLTYAIGHEGVQFWPDYAQPHTLASITTGQPANGDTPAIALVRNEAVRPQMPYFYGISGQAADWPSLASAGSAVFVTDYQPQEITLRPAGLLNIPESSDAPLALFNKGQIILEAAKAAPSGNGTAVHLTWRVIAPPPNSLTIFVHVIDSSGQLLTQADGDPIAGSFPLAQWPAGLTAEDQRYIPITGSGLQILVGLYDRNTGERWTAESPSGQPFPDNAIPIK